MTKKLISRVVAALLPVLLLVSLVSFGQLSAATVSSSMSVLGNAFVGRDITVNLSLSGGTGQYANFDGWFEFDANLFDLKSIEAGQVGGARFNTSGTGFTAYDGTISSGSTVVTAKFTCKAAGTGTIRVIMNDVGDMDGNSLSVSNASTQVTIIRASSNANLASLSVSPGMYSPEFSPSRQSYSMSVSENVTRIAVDARVEDSNARVALNGVQNNLQVGTNNVRITVTAQDGSTKTYTLTVNRSAGPTPEPLPLLHIDGFDGTTFTILDPRNLADFPENFGLDMIEYEGVDVPVFSRIFGEGDDAYTLYLIYLVSDDDTGFYIYDPDTQQVAPYSTLDVSVWSFIVLGASTDLGTPAGYEAFTYETDDMSVPAFRRVDEPDHPQILLYLLSPDGTRDLYLYDTNTGLAVPYEGAYNPVEPTPEPDDEVIETEPPIVVEPEIDAPDDTDVLGLAALRDFRQPMTILAYALMLLCLAFASLAIGFLVAFLRNKTRSEEAMFQHAPYAPAEQEPRHVKNTSDDKLDVPTWDDKGSASAPGDTVTIRRVDQPTAASDKKTLESRLDRRALTDEPTGGPGHHAATDDAETVPLDPDDNE